MRWIESALRFGAPLGLLLAVGTSLMSCGSEGSCLAACPSAITLELARPLSGSTLRIGLEPGQTVITCNATVEGDPTTPFACEPALGQVELEFTPQRELLAITWYGMGAASYRFFVEADGAEEVSYSFAHAPARGPDVCGSRCNASVRIVVPNER